MVKPIGYPRNKRLEDAIADENYEYAKMYKDELRRREEEEDTNK